MSLREEIFDIVTKISKNLKSEQDHIIVNEIISKIEKRIDEMIEVDEQTLSMKRGTQEGKTAAQTSKNTLILVKEMLKN